MYKTKRTACHAICKYIISISGYVSSLMLDIVWHCNAVFHWLRVSLESALISKMKQNLERRVHPIYLVKVCCFLFCFLLVRYRSTLLISSRATSRVPMMTSYHGRKLLLHHWPFVRAIYRSPVDTLHKYQQFGNLMFSIMKAISQLPMYKGSNHVKNMSTLQWRQMGAMASQITGV